MQIFKAYLMSFYDDWNEEDLIYSKWKLISEEDNKETR